MQGRGYEIYDVFTSEVLTGNQLAVVHDTASLDTARMQAIAREFNLSETIFVLPPNDPAHEARIRIFVPARELPFAGHPTVGGAVAIAARRFGKGAHAFALEEQVGIIACRILISDGPGRAEFDLPRLPQKVEIVLSTEKVAAALGLDASDIGFDGHIVSAWSAGMPYVTVPLNTIEAVRRAKVNSDAWLDHVKAPGGITAAPYLYCRGGAFAGSSFHARMFAPWDGIAEDPATGSAAAALAGALSEFERLADGKHLAVIEQGVEMGRASFIKLTLNMREGTLASASIGGHAVKVAEGRLFA